jgi:hypothetical protein
MENPQIYLNYSDALALRYLTEYETIEHLDDATSAKSFALRRAIRHLWGVLDNLILFAKYNSSIVIRDEIKGETEFDPSTLCDTPDYLEEHETNTEIEISEDSFILLEALLRRVAHLVADGRYPEQDEILRMAIRLRAKSVRIFLDKEHKREFGIKTPDGLMDLIVV